MKLLLKHYFSNTRREFDIEFSLNNVPESVNDTERCRGVYAECTGKVIGLAALDDRLYVLYDGSAIEVDGSFSVRYISDKQAKKLVVAKGDQQYSVEYANENGPVSTQFYSEDEEDSDFGLWLSNVLSSPERTNILLSSWLEGAL